MEIRKITSQDDRASLSRVYEQSWKSAYRNIIPQNYLDSIPEGRWAKSADKPGMNTMLLVDDDKIIGTSGYCSSRFPEMSGYGEIVSIYLLPEFTGQGLGLKLFKTVIADLQAQGFRDIFLWVLEENLHARRFYERFGFTYSGKYLDDNIGGRDLRELQYVYHIK
ncbi:MAG: GNAT family N-acetyltransferase [Oscillospiraceae bacterium]|nr:GNAT family N-acetyltransferase [Oscillospiraceae bacterium]